MISASDMIAKALVLFLLPCIATTQYQYCQYDLSVPGSGQGSAIARIKENQLEVEFVGAVPNTVYTIWVDFKSRATGFLASDYPIVTDQGAGVPRGVAPAFAKTAPVYEGMQLDQNAVKTDGNGNAIFSVNLDYNLLGVTTSPVVAETLTLQNNGNRIGGSWMRVYEVTGEPSSQVLDGSGVPQLVLATAQGLTIVGHFKAFTHGHTPGVGGIDHFPGFFGDMPQSCRVGAPAIENICDVCGDSDEYAAPEGIQCCYGDMSCKQLTLDLGVKSLCCKGKQACMQIDGIANNAHTTQVACIGEQACKQANFGNFGQVNVYCGDGDDSCGEVIY